MFLSVHHTTRNTSNTRGEIRTGDFYIKAYCYSASVCGLVVPLVLSLLLMVKPDMPPFIGWLLWHPGDHIVKDVLLSFWNFLMLTSILSSVVLAVVYGTLLKLYALFTYLRLLRVASNWQKALLSTKPLEKRLTMFKQVQLLAKLYNECYQWIFYIWFLSVGYFVISVNLYAFVTFHKEVSVLGSVFLMVVFSQGLIFVALLSSVAGQIYYSSRLIPRAWLRSPLVHRNRRMRKAVKACSGIKIRMGSVNFVDRLTPFVLIGLCLKLTVRMLMATM
jgi:hypothetical protein